MDLVLADEGSQAIIERALNNDFPTTKDLYLCLYTNDHEPTDEDTVATYTEASGGGYATKTLTTGSWTIESGNDPRDAIYATQVFTFTGPLDGNAVVYGYFIKDAEDKLWWAQRRKKTNPSPPPDEIDDPFQPVNNGDKLSVFPFYAQSQGTPAA